MKLIAHTALERLIHHLMLLNPRLADEGGGNNRRRIVIAVAAQILDIHPGVGDRLLDQPLDLGRVHRHRRPPMNPSAAAGIPHGSPRASSAISYSPAPA